MLIFLRHGQSTANAQGLLVGRTDVELTERGRDQASSLLVALSKVEAVVSSSLRRARDTARLAIEHLDADIDDAFIEQDYGTHDGLAFDEVPADEWREFLTTHDAALGGGESLADVDARVHRRLEEWLADDSTLLADWHRHLVVVSHVTPIKSAVTWALGVPGSVAWRMRLDNASLTTIGVRDGRPFLAGYNDVSARGQTPSRQR